MPALWDTTGTEVVRKLSAERRTAGGVASGLALTLVAITDERRVAAVEDAATVAAAEHPCRLLVTVRDPQVDVPSRLDAEIVVGGRLGPCEAVIMRMRGRLALHAESVVMPLLAPDVPVVTWWHCAPPGRIAYDPLGVVAERRVTDVAECPDLLDALRQRGADYAPGDTDLSWTRITPWRTLLAGAFDTVDAPVTSVEVAAPPGDPGAALLAGWLTVRLGVTATIAPAKQAKRGKRGRPGEATTGGGPAHADPGLAGVSIVLADGGVLSLARRDGTATLSRTGCAERVLPLVPRRLGDELAEELRRLDADQPYAAALGAATGVTGLNERSPTRVHLWHDPALAERPEALS